MSAEPLGWFPEDWATALPDQPAFRARQIFRWLHKQGVTDPSRMTNLNAALKQRVGECLGGLELSPKQVQCAADGTRKLLLVLSDGTPIESVLIPMKDEPEEEPEEQSVGAAPERVTFCVSTQHGCPARCVFCASGEAGFRRQLSAGEIVLQVLALRRLLEPNERVTNLVFMGMGEPLLNYDATARALRLLSHAEGCGLGLRRMTVSTVGVPAGIAQLGRDFGGKVGLAVSLHAPNDELRNRLIPYNRKLGLAALKEALLAYPLPQRRRITIEYTLFSGVNDTEGHARELVRWLRNLSVKVNLIPMNPVPFSELRGSEPATCRAFQEWLLAQGISCSIRTRRGDELAAACGQLAFSDRPRQSAEGEP